ncbi:hypothetical protein HWI79_2124 [Cryptosporidium felis]|nr:hypothetical protein HWI79_2124 [Cryptosporidium felis]
MEKQELSFEKKEDKNSNYIRYSEACNLAGDESVINHGSTTSLRDLCGLLLTSFCGILDEFGLNTHADEELLFMAMDSGDFDTVFEYVKLFRNKISSILLLSNMRKNSREIDQNCESFDTGNLQEAINNDPGHKNNSTSDSERNETEVEDNTNIDYLSPKKVVKKSPVPPLNVEKAGHGSWNRGQLPNEYPIE